MSTDKDYAPLKELKDIKYYCRCGAGSFKNETRLERHILIKHHGPKQQEIQ
jgi:hypothetical protein